MNQATAPHPSQPATHGGSTEVLVARQPIFDAERRVVAYELLHRTRRDAGACVEDDDRATASVITASFVDIGMARMVEGRPAFINVGREFLLSGAALALPREDVVLEILEHVHVDATLVAAVRALVDAGYRVALDDFAFDERWRSLLELAHIVKIDVMAVGIEHVHQQVEALAAFDVELLAEKVESEAEHEALRPLGFRYYQGFFFARPAVLSGSRLPANQAATLRLLAALQDPSTDIDVVAALVIQDPSLSYRLLRFINSAFLALPQRITTIHRAVVYVGLGAVKRWVTLMVLAGISNKSSELTRLALTRARMMELVCQRRGTGEPAAGFTVGLFSLLDAFMDRPLAELLADLPLSAEVCDALLARGGPYGPLLRRVVDYERAHWNALERSSGPPSLEELAHAYAEALEWSAAAAAAAR